MSENQSVQQKKKIALVANNSWSMYNFRMDLIRHLQLNFKILIIAPKDEFAGELTRAGCSYIHIDFDNRSVNPLQDYKLYKSLKEIYRTEKPDLIFHYVIKPNIYGSLAAASCGIPSIAVITGLGYSFDKKDWLNRVVAILYRKALKKPGAVWFLNADDAAVFKRRKLVPPEKIKILPGEGINTTFFFPAANRPVARSKAFQFLMSSRLLKSKGVRTYVEAAKLLKIKYRDVRFELIGFFEKNHPDAISESYIRHWQKHGIIHYSGFVKDVRPFLRQADCFVFPSFYHEGIPRCLLEAASMEIPIITSLTAGCKEVVQDKVNGFLCEPGNAIDLAARMEDMIVLDSVHRASLGRRSRQIVSEHFGIEKILTIYDDAISSLGLN
jgi:glycosyltransferase involved in cell wall biosynthesis